MNGYEPDELSGYHKLTQPLPPEEDGELRATLVRRGGPPRPGQPGVLYVHGFADYFFQAHLGEVMARAGFAFYALDLRRYGRSLRRNNVPNQFKRIDDYFVELTWAIRQMREEGVGSLGCIGHSTGCLILSLYTARGAERGSIDCLVLNSPFFEFAVSPLRRRALSSVQSIGQLFPLLKTPLALNPAYGQSLHRSEKGEWDYDLEKKPLRGFGITSGWLSGIGKAHAEVQNGLDLRCPILVLHSSASYPSTQPYSPDIRRADAVLDVAHMKAIAPRLGARVELREIPGGIHDLYLSAPEPREHALSATIQFFETHIGVPGAPSSQRPRILEAV